ncbi:hypothetical protein SAMN05444266_104137 [Chitinophaga jiangningensis]|uniref:Uncharacterized protein n=1 Tax=Chitinophaga jiangningensis TaxID=1419482 RepID=A0A1M7BZJ3_9BACT|nr:hypothetical protein SAMN05444266_104137 [Chitinophaga jiangningensis]
MYFAVPVMLENTLGRRWVRYLVELSIMQEGRDHRWRPSCIFRSAEGRTEDANRNVIIKVLIFPYQPGSFRHFSFQVPGIPSAVAQENRNLCIIDLQGVDVFHGDFKISP